MNNNVQVGRYDHCVINCTYSNKKRNMGDLVKPIHDGKL